MTDPRRLDDQIELLTEELDDLDRQVADGDLDASTAAELADRYRNELDGLRREREAIGAGSAAPDGPDPGRRGPRVSLRTLVGAAIVGVAIVAITVFAVVSLDDADTGAEGIAGDVLGDGGGVDLSQISDEQMEEVVARNPDVVGMRLALARRYFEAGSFDRALDHYFEVLEREQHPEALANIGWMTYLSGRPDVAVEYLETALARDPGYLPATWFIANVYVTLGRGAEAVPYLARILDADDVPVEIRDNAETLLAEIEGGS